MSTTSQSGSQQTITPKAKFPNQEDQQRYQAGLTTLMQENLPSQYGTNSPDQVSWDRGLKVHELLTPMTEEQIDGIVADHKAVRRASQGSRRT